MFTGMVALGGMVLLILLLIGAIVLLPKKPEGNSTLQQLVPTISATYEPQSVRPFSIREQTEQEDAEALAGEFRRVRREKYLEELRADAAAAFAPAKSSK